MVAKKDVRSNVAVIRISSCATDTVSNCLENPTLTLLDTALVMTTNNKMYAVQ